MPWQRLVADVGGEYDPDTGLPFFRQVVFTVPRQSGKTSLILAWEVQRAVGWDGPQRIVYSAQSGNDARKKLVEDQIPLLEAASKPLGVGRPLKGMGNEAIPFSNGSRIVLLASTEKSGHGKTIDLAVKDEFFADHDDRRDQALIPAMATRPRAQVLTASTAGTEESVPFNRLVERGRASVAAGKRSGIAYFEWSADPDDDPDDQELWWGFMPALGHTITPDVVEDARQSLTPSEFDRAFRNLKTVNDERVIPHSVWRAVCDDNAEPEGPLKFAVDVNPERSAGAILSGSQEERPRLELVEHRSGTGWMVDRAAELDERWGPTSWAVDSSGPAASLVPDLRKKGLQVVEVARKDLVTACASFLDSLVDRRFRVRTHSHLDDAVAAAAKKSVGDSFCWTRRGARGDICPLVAATLVLAQCRQSSGAFVLVG